MTNDDDEQGLPMQSRLERARELIWSPTSKEDCRRGIALMHAEFLSGDRAAGYELAMLSRSLIPPEYTLPRAVRVDLILEAATGGDEAAVLELAHVYSTDVPSIVLHEVLSAAAERGSIEARELLGPNPIPPRPH